MDDMASPDHDVVPPAPTHGWLPPSAPGSTDATDAYASAPTAPPAWTMPGQQPPPPPPPVTPTGGKPSGPSSRKSILLGTIAGAITAALVAGGIAVATDDPATTPIDRAVATPLITGNGALDIQAILTKVRPSVVAIETTQSTARGVFQGAGSGIVISKDGLILTNAHVADSGLGDMNVVFSDGSKHKAALVGSSPGDDVALIKATGVTDLTPAELGSSSDLRVGDEVIAIGNALNLGGEPTVTRGIVSAKDREIDAESEHLEGLIQTDAAINPGNSGGPLVNAAGQVVAMNTAIVQDAQNLGFSIAMDHIKPLIDQLKAGKGEGTVTLDQAFLGVGSVDVEGLADDVKETYGVELDHGALVTEVAPGSAADDAGVEVGDVITEVDGKAIDSSSDVRSEIVGHKPGDKITITVVRKGDEKTLHATLGQRGDATG
jgi:putative serine protease PepD